MDGGATSGVRGIFRSIAFIVFAVTSAYLVLELVIALSAQGEPTGAVAPFNGAEVVYPDWYQAPEFLDAVRVALVAYPVAALFYGIGMLAAWARRAALPEQPRMLAELPVTEGEPSPGGTVMPAAESADELCVVSADRRIHHIAPETAQLFGLTPRDMLGQSLELFLSPTDLPKLDALIATACAERPRAFVTTVGILLTDGALGLIDITCRAAEDGLMPVAGAAILTMKPFSERGRLDDQLAALWY